MACARINLYAQSFGIHIRTLVRTPDWRFPRLDFVSLSLFIVSNIIVASLLPSWQKGVVYLVLAHLVSGFLHVQITISHFGMPVNEHADDPTANYDFIKTQFEHSLDVDCPWWMDWLHGGLQFQVVHHLFPRVPRHNLRYIRDTYVIPYAQKHNITYHHLSFFDANKFVVDRLRDTAMKARDVPNENLASWSTTLFSDESIATKTRRISTEFRE
jgi:delta8-fatty-acid desaturase